MMSSFFGAEEERFVCHECFQEHHAYFLKRLEALTSETEGTPAADQMRQIRAVRDETDEYMRRWVSQKLN
jgi:hypothetical protein